MRLVEAVVKVLQVIPNTSLIHGTVCSLQYLSAGLGLQAEHRNWLNAITAMGLESSQNNGESAGGPAVGLENPRYREVWRSNRRLSATCLRGYDVLHTES